MRGRNPARLPLGVRGRNPANTPHFVLPCGLTACSTSSERSRVSIQSPQCGLPLRRHRAFLSVPAFPIRFSDRVIDPVPARPVRGTHGVRSATGWGTASRWYSCAPGSGASVISGRKRCGNKPGSMGSWRMAWQDSRPKFSSTSSDGPARGSRIRKLLNMARHGKGGLMRFLPGMPRRRSPWQRCWRGISPNGGGSGTAAPSSSAWLVWLEGPTFPPTCWAGRCWGSSSPTCGRARSRSGG